MAQGVLPFKYEAGEKSSRHDGAEWIAGVSRFGS